MLRVIDLNLTTQNPGIVNLQDKVVVSKMTVVTRVSNGRTSPGELEATVPVQLGTSLLGVRKVRTMLVNRRIAEWAERAR